MNHTVRTLPFLLVCFLVCLTSANAQSGSVYFAGGTATDSSSGPVNTLGGGTIYNSPSMGGFFETIGGDVILRHGLGVGAEVSFRKDQGAYAGLGYRPEFYDINAVYQPLHFTGRIVPEVQGGAGRISLRFYDTPAFCQTFFEGCRSTTGQISTVNHFQLHFAGGVRFYVVKGLFVRPQVDFHFVRNFVEFGSSWVPEYSVAVGYTFRRGR